MKTRICFISPSAHSKMGGAESQLRHLLKTLGKRGVYAFIITRDIGSEIEQEVVDEIPTYFLFSRLGSFSFVLSAIAFLMRRVSEFDIVHVHTHCSPVLIGVPFRLFFGKKVIVLMRGSAEDISKARYLILKHVADKFIVLNQFAHDNLNNAGIDSEKIVKMRNGVDLYYFKPCGKTTRKKIRAKYGLRGETVVSSVTRLVPVKQVHLSVDIMRELVKINPKTMLLIVGDGPQRKELEKTIEDLRLQSHVRLLGECNKETVREILQISDYYLQTSASEGMSNSILEAMSTGLPAIVSDIPANREIIVNGTDGCLCNNEIISEYIDTFKTLFKDGRKKAGIGLNARKRVGKNNDIREICREYITLYSCLLSGKNA
ncbi:MAG: glycosyltransferase family 4 protein [Candidatus Altiarchaeota archaeon]|nr:glycosyltransferase family 4 protein [Candidatus Altiarchaeota archaeon]